jgi:chitin disaccharide deacetylase
VNGARHVIVNADDLGLSAGVNRGIADAYDHGVVTSASLMVSQPAAEAAAAWAHTRPDLSLGIHLDLCEWEYRGGEWALVYERAPLDDPAQVATEVARQLDCFRELTGRTPTHVDCHQHVHRDEPARTVIAAAAAAMRVPLRDHSAAYYAGGFYGQTKHGEPLPELISADALVDLLTSLPEGWSEVGCHAGYAEDAPTSYREERRREVAALCSPLVRAAVEHAGIELHPFVDLPCP